MKLGPSADPFPLKLRTSRSVRFTALFECAAPALGLLFVDLSQSGYASRDRNCPYKGLGRIGDDKNSYSSDFRPADKREGVLVRIAIGFTSWAERWFPDAFIFVAIAVVVVAAASLANGASPAAVSAAFGNGFWSLITFTMQMAFVAIGDTWSPLPRRRAG